VKKIILILALSVLLIGCDADVNTVEAEKKYVLKLEKDKQGSYFNEVMSYIITDTETDQEYIVVKNVSKGGVAITPRLKPETVLKERE